MSGLWTQIPRAFKKLRAGLLNRPGKGARLWHCFEIRLSHDTIISLSGNSLRLRQYRRRCSIYILLPFSISLPVPISSIAVCYTSFAVDIRITALAPPLTLRHWSGKVIGCTRNGALALSTTTRRWSRRPSSVLHIAIRPLSTACPLKLAIGLASARL